SNSLAEIAMGYISWDADLAFTPCRPPTETNDARARSATGHSRCAGRQSAAGGAYHPSPTRLSSFIPSLPVGQLRIPIDPRPSSAAGQGLPHLVRTLGYLRRRCNGVCQRTRAPV